MKESFLIFKAFYAPIETLSDEDLGRLFRWIFLYQIKGIEPTNTDRVFMAFQFFKNQFRLDELKYSKVVNRNKNNGSKGGRPKTQDKQENPVGFLEPKKADNVNDNVKDKDINSVFSFSEFWSLYPNKVSKQKCETKYKRLSEKDREQIKNTIHKFLNYKPFPNYTHPNPETYLNQKRWEDVIPEIKPQEYSDPKYSMPTLKSWTKEDGSIIEMISNDWNRVKYPDGRIEFTQRINLY